jgi:hypothetical protein
LRDVPDSRRAGLSGLEQFLAGRMIPFDREML